MGFFHPALIHDPGQAERSRPAEVRRVELAPHEVPAWKGLRLAQSSAGPSFGIGSSAGPVGGSINPYTAVPGSAATDIGATTGDTGRGFGGDSAASGFNGTQQEQGGGAGVGSSGAASPSSNGASPRAAVPTSGEAANHGAPGSPEKGARLMETGESVKAPPPASLTDSPPSQPASPRAKKPRKGSGAHSSSRRAPAKEPGADSTPPPPPPAETGIGSTR